MIFTVDSILEPPHDKTNEMTVHPAKTQEPSLCAHWVAKVHWDSEDADQTGWMPRLI